MQQLTKQNLWKSLEDHAQTLHAQTLNRSHQRAPCPTRQYTACNIRLDYSHQHVTDHTLELLFSLAKRCSLQEKIQGLLTGDKVNLSENRPALHTALRAPEHTEIWVDGHNIMEDVIVARHKMKALVEQIRNKQWLGFSGQPIRDIVNIGMGGSDLGPRFCIKAFADYRSPDFGYHFISDADPNSFNNAVAMLNPETTLFIVSSKSFTTQETLYNARKAMAWIGHPKHYDRHFIAVTAQVEKAYQFGIPTVLPIWNWVGGRYSFCSAINLIGAIALGYESFNQILAGAHSMDQHFQHSQFSDNLPILLGLLGVWNNNFLSFHNLLILTYAQQLEQLMPYIQQLDMESNGKSIDNQGNPVRCATGPLVWGGPGNQAQHSYYQLLCQGTHKVAADIITLKSFEGQIINDMAAAKIEVLAYGVHDKDPNAFISGNLPLNHLCLEDCSPFTIGALIALYEHKIFTQSIIWDINAFDQPGVESAKRTRLLQKTEQSMV
ncbi:glucose-6-phosphate isomerase [Legionella oakridgensis]|uniref:Glucose-6-phosphate isomerase n=2 Tax=Legionella oakridgensis TaxID=29423 RepID=W0B9W0_9GAMM|nr:glucose-6-phosphate isomerase [Legionella oakridgensis]AHE66650.1 glucose-6-phosphate isomerase [Legionella oakridgensis ATCC 33761 = DSM 21215]ETO93617.1 glucose-6-phosphate isomerase [Legionella oakridgensis RV-2-2007]KTD37757.1 glucose-6-phosphate isomerase [Legionella oakridgensis]STY19791.1 glucose-6-phosphate isomerase [Legionella longbeachae]